MKAAFISIDGLDIEDLDAFSQTECIGSLLKNASVARSTAVTPAQTYACHASMLSGCYPARTGVADNLSHPDMQWQWQRSSIKVPVITDTARSAGLSTAAVCFPVTAGADITYLIPEIWTERDGDDPDPVFRSSSSEAGYEYYLRHRSKLDWMRTPGMDEFAAAAFSDIIRERRPDLALLHLSYLDHQKHLSGPRAEDVPHAVSFIDSLMKEAVDAMGDDYVIFIAGDHGHRAQSKAVNFSGDSRIVIHPTGMSAEVYLSGIAEDEAARELLCAEGISRVWRRDEFPLLGLSGAFSLFAECAPGYAFSKDGSVTPSGHGYVGEKGPYPPFIASGAPEPFRRDVCSLVDEAPTVLSLFGLAMPEADGEPLF